MSRNPETVSYTHLDVYKRQGHYIKYGKRKAMEIATLGCAVRVKLSQDKKRIEDVRLGYGCLLYTSRCV